ncbi:MAG: Trp family transcriptional regulator [Sphaerochaetaceae bacterium]|nr:Trp family transcriptional regulator [Sphaerochaetaceae bacterium]
MNDFDDLISIFCDTTDPDEMKRLFSEMFTDREQQDFVLRWDLLKDLYQGIPQREIAAKHKISLCKITRGSKILKKDQSFVRSILSDRYDDHIKL